MPPGPPEAFVDRGYMPDGSLVPRGRPGAFIHDPEEAAARMVRLVKEGVVTAADGSELRLKAITNGLVVILSITISYMQNIKRTMR